ncbi:uncharacterized protein LOC111637111 [Centruroides sculpturatus]|uniref:uncharacterized protein LOC111637111 n=1 Tax=Centruroides sculpturatus TaxID=218467 RepID=UPI000C6C8ECD|nr:uncharacterized protein LOC111637111 [Centruroides sculpturatus]
MQAFANFLFVRLFAIFSMINVLFQLINVLYIFPNLEKQQQFNELFFVMLKKGFLNLSKDLYLVKLNNCNLEAKLWSIINRHAALWEVVEQINTKINYSFLMYYVIITFGTSFFYYMYLFISINAVLRLVVAMATVLCTILCILYGLILCSFTFTMHNSFQDIRRFAAVSLSLERKLYFLDFMKRFGKISLRLSIGGFFYVTKRFPIRIANTLYTVFSGLLKSREVSYKRKYCKEILSMNITKSY